jgi:hypothetical protein
MNTTRFPEFLPGSTIEKSMADLTSTPEGKLTAIGMYNNCNIRDSKDRWVLIHATVFVCQGIARQLGYKVYKALPKHGPNHYVVDTRRGSHIQVVPNHA